jgi:nucleotide-binding universal stress UspA family protein
MKKILIPIDFSKCSLAAARYAAKIAEKHNSSLYLLHIISNPHLYFVTSDVDMSSSMIYAERKRYIDRLESDAKNKLEELRKSYFVRNLKVDYAVIVGSSINKDIVDYAKTKKIDLILMGSNGNDNFERIVLGSNSERVFRFTDIPVLIVGQRVKSNDIKKVVFASDFTPEAIQVYPVLSRFIKPYEPDIHLIRINTENSLLPTEEAIRRMKKMVKRFKGNFITDVRAAYEVYEGITKYAKEVNADLIAIGALRRKGLSRFFSNRIIEGVIRRTRIPVLTIDIPKK